QLKHSSINSPRGGPPEPEETQRWVPFDLLRDKKEVALSDIERCYDIGRVIGDGNFAIVRECRRRDTGQSLAMKIVERSKLIGREHMMQNELSLLGSLSHPCVVRLFAHYHTHTQAYLVLELVNGGDLFEAIARRGKFPEDEAGLIVADVSGALSYIHSKSIVHRDLKPENLLVSGWSHPGDVLKLGDFGLAMVVTEPIFTVCGTPTYVAPEILSETGYGLSVDVWALGVILYILLCGFPPFRSQDRDQEELFKLIREGKVHFLSNYWDPVSEGEDSNGTPIGRLNNMCLTSHAISICFTCVCVCVTAFFPLSVLQSKMMESQITETTPQAAVSDNTADLHRLESPESWKTGDPDSLSE
uniref:Doublecortin-like kinase 3 n=1 Tax=Gadus morhua TaxID=8049 RepID=A0A8C4ZCQ5_GADMO